MGGEQHHGDGTHASVQPLLNDFVDGTLVAAEQVRVEAHVRDCGTCQAEVAALRALLDTAHALPSEFAPQEDLWPDLEKRIRQRPVVVAGGQPSHAAAYPVREFPRWLRGGVAAAAVLLVLAASAWWARRADRSPAGTGPLVRRPHSAATANLEPGPLPAVVRGLEIECMGAGKLFQASLTYDERGDSIAESVRDGVELVDRSIAETRAALETHPDDSRLVRQLAARYQQKLDLLLGAMRLAGNV